MYFQQQHLEIPHQHQQTFSFELHESLSWVGYHDYGDVSSFPIMREQSTLLYEIILFILDKTNFNHMSHSNYDIISINCSYLLFSSFSLISHFVLGPKADKSNLDQYKTLSLPYYHLCIE